MKLRHRTLGTPRARWELMPQSWVSTWDRCPQAQQVHQEKAGTGLCQLKTGHQNPVSSDTPALAISAMDNIIVTA